MQGKKILCLLLCLTMLMGMLVGCEEQELTNTEESVSTVERTPPSTDPPDAEPAVSDPEIKDAMTLFEIPDGWLDDLDVQVTCTEMADLLEVMLCARLEYPNPVTLSWLNSPDWVDNTTCYRGQASVFIYRLALENYYGIENAEESWQYGAFDYVHTLDCYHNRLGIAIPCLEYKQFNEGSLPENENIGFDVWGVAYCTLQMDMTNYLTIFDVDEEGAVRYDEYITRREAIIACKRLYNAYLDNAPVPVATVGKQEFTAEQLRKAAQMPDASWDNLPAWSGMCIELANQTGYMRESDFALRQEYGIDFARIYIRDEIFQWNGEEMTIPRYWLDNFDDAITWAIEYGVHLCFMVDEEGFDGASMNTDGFYSDELTTRFIACNAMLARRYADLPNSVFSLNIFNEPWMLSLEDEELYVSKVREVIAAIREYGEDRLIFVDGLAGSQQPVYSLAEDRVALSTHMYGPDSLYTAGWDGNAWWYAGQQWPYDYAPGFLFGSGEGYTLKGNFPEGMLIQILLGINDDTNGALRLYADGVLIDSLAADAENRDNMRQYLPLPTEAKELVLEWTGSAGVGVRGIVLVYPEKGEEEVPRVVSPWNDGTYSDTVVENKIVQIVCEVDFVMDGEYTNPVISVADDGTYTVSHDGDKRYTYGKEYYAAILEKWVAFSEETGVAVMVQEWGPYADAYISQEAAVGVVVAGAEAMQEAGFPWCIWVDMLNTTKLDIEPLKNGTYRINESMIAALRPYMQTE